MLVPVHVTDSVRPMDDVVTALPSRAVPTSAVAAEGMATAQRPDDITRHRRRKAHGVKAASRMLRRRARPAA